jgi:hypothetical protein
MSVRNKNLDRVDIRTTQLQLHLREKNKKSVNQINGSSCKVI